jgi:hypothetical protein
LAIATKLEKILDDTSWISGFVGVYSLLLLALILYMKKTDPVFGCDKYKRTGCKEVSGLDCGYPDCDKLREYRSGCQPM